jgi:WhiB family redox-sensing transcriptional regulator
VTAVTDWRDLAECQDLVTAEDDPFFDGGEDNERAAIAICQLCRVQDACLTYAIHTGQQYGVWGGRSQAELRRLVAADRRGQRRSEQAPTGHFNASKTRCKRGHLFTAANTHYAADGSRRCRACLRDAYVAWARRTKRQAGPAAGEGVARRA